jgi:hypothetical protein
VIVTSLFESVGTARALVDVTDWPSPRQTADRRQGRFFHHKLMRCTMPRVDWPGSAIIALLAYG